jgi:hypothetical protein
MMCPSGHLTGGAVEDSDLGGADDSLGREDKWYRVWVGKIRREVFLAGSNCRWEVCLKEIG